jgi:hypothetical protein
METTQKKTPAKSATRPAAQSVLLSAATVNQVTRSRLQAASKVSSPQDAEEKEADNTAQKVMRMAIPGSSIAMVPTPRGGVFRQVTEEQETPQRKPLQSPYIARFANVSIVARQAVGESEEKIQRKAAAEDEEQVQRQAEGEEEEQVQRQAEGEEEEQVQRQAEGEEEEQIQRQAEGEEEEQVQRQAEDEEEEQIQRQAEEEEEEQIQRKAEDQEEQVQRQAEEEEEEQVQRQAEGEEEEQVQRKAEGTPDAGANVSAEIRSSKSGGRPLPLSVRRFMEPRFQADFSSVRIHTDDNAANLNKQVRARAFAVDNHVFFGQGQYQPETDEGRELIAHELTHTIQQGGAVQRKESPRVTQRTGSKVQRLGISDALDYFADRAHNIPGFRMFTIVLGVNPINMSRVDRSAANILRAIVEFLPGGALITQALDNHGIFDRVGTWVEQQFRSLAMTGAAIRRAVDRFLDSLGWRDIFSLGDVWRRAKRIFTEPIGQLISFGRGLFRGIIQFIKDAILRPLAALVSRTAGYGLLTAVLGFDPITGDAVPRTAETLIGGFMRLIGQEEVWENIKRANAVARAWAWFQGALAGLMGFVRQIPTLFLNAFRQLQIVDIVVVPRAVARIIFVFAGFAGRFISWAGGQVMQLLQIIFEVVAPGAMPFIRRARGAFRSIIRNPMGFVSNLVRAGQLGLNNFAANFLTHLRASLIGWITGAMSGAGVYIPQAFSLREILKFILSVLGLTWQNIRVKLVRAVGETAVSAMETGFELVRTLVTEGPAAAWQKILEGIQNLRDMVMEQIMSFVQTRIVQAAITRLVSMLSPAGAFIQAIIATYNTIMFFVERMRTIAQVAMSFVNSIAAIAAGQIGPAAARVEQTMAGLLTLVISFLARIAGLGRVSDAVTRIIDRVRQPIDRALDRVVAWIVRQARRLGRFVAQAGVPQDPQERLRLGMARAVSVVNRLPRGGLGESVINTALAAIKMRYGFRVLVPYQQGNKWWVRGEINPVSAMATNQNTGDQEELSFSQNEWIKVRYTAGMWVAQIKRITSSNVSYEYRDPRKPDRTTPKVEFQQMISRGEVARYNASSQSKRDQYMGSNPPRWGSFDQQVLNRYRLAVTKKYVGNPPPSLQKARIRFPKRSSGSWFPLNQCDLSHEPVDAVTFWNSLSGEDKKPRSPVVRAFMTNPMNYIFEPSSSNRSRASRDNARYTDPHVV